MTFENPPLGTQGTRRTVPRRVLVLKPCCIGDVLLASPLVAAVNAGWRDVVLDWAADPHSRAAAAGIPGVTDVIDAHGAVPGAFSASGLVALVKRIRKGNYDLVFVPDRSRVLAWVARLSGVPERVGLDSGGRGRSYTIRVGVTDQPVRHEAEIYADLGRAVGLPIGAPRLRFVPTAGDRHWAAAALARLMKNRGDGQTSTPAGPTRLRVVAIHPGGGVNPGMRLPEKRWPADRIAEVARALAADGLATVVLGGPTDAEAVAAVLAAAPDAYDLSATAAGGAATLSRTAAVIAEAAAYLGNDTGISHLAAAVGTPAVVVFGPTDPERYGPLPGSGVAIGPVVGDSEQRPAAEHVQRPAVAGPVRHLEQARGSRAVESVRVEAVLAALRGALAGR